LPGRGFDCNETWIDDLLQVVADGDVAVIAAHQLDRVARLDGRVSELVRNINALALNDVIVGDARQQRASVAEGNRMHEDAGQGVPRRGLGAVAAGGWGLAVDRIDIPDFPGRAGLSATRVNLIRSGAAERSKAKKAGCDQRARIFQSHGQPSTQLPKTKVQGGWGRFTGNNRSRRRRAESMQGRLRAQVHFARSGDADVRMR